MVVATRAQDKDWFSNLRSILINMMMMVALTIVTKCDKGDKVWQALIFQSEMHYDQHDDDLVALIVVKISKDWTPLVTFFLSLSEVLPEHHRDPRARREASQNLGSSPVVVRFCDSIQNSHPF